MNLDIDARRSGWLLSDTLNNVSRSGDFTPSSFESPTGILCKQNGIARLEVNDFKPLTGGPYPVGRQGKGNWKDVWPELQVADTTKQFDWEVVSASTP